MNIIVEQTPLPDHLGRASWSAPVGIVRWHGTQPYWSLIVKLSYRYDTESGDLQLLDEPLGLQLDGASELPGAAEDELAYASDFVFHKGGAEILLTGCAVGKTGEDVTSAGVRVLDGDEILLEHGFGVAADSASGQRPLTTGSLRAIEGDGPATAVAPCARPRPEPDDGPLDEIDFLPYFSGSAAQRMERLPTDGAIELFGLAPTTKPLRLTLPRLHPFAMIETREQDLTTVDLDCDTVWIDTDRALFVTVWRGVIPIPSRDGSAFRRIVVGLEDIDRPRTYDQAMASLHRGDLSLAVTEDALLNPEAHASTAQAVLAAARLQRDQREPQRRLSLQAYAEVAAHVAEGGPHASKALTAHDLDGPGWTIEERAWLHAISEDASKGSAGEGLALQVSAAFQAAQDAIGPDEPERDLNTYVAMRVAIESQGDPSRTLAQHHMTLAAWMRLDRAWSRRGKDDPACGQQLRDALSEERARLRAMPTEAIRNEEES
jgi:hypothetical protein